MQRSLRRRLMAKMRRARLVRTGPVAVLQEGFEGIDQLVEGLSQGWVGPRVAARATDDSGIFSMLAAPPVAVGLPRL